MVERRLFSDALQLFSVECLAGCMAGLLPLKRWASKGAWGAAGPSGLDYAAIPCTAKMIGIKRRGLEDVFPDLRVMENEALAVMAEA